MERVNKILYHPIFRSTLRQIERLESERIFCLHNLDHVLSVARIMLLCAREEGIEIAKEVLYATALLHDLGRAYQEEQGDNHARLGLALAKDILTDCSFSEEEREHIVTAIANHNQAEASDPLSALLQKADKLSRNCFLCPAYQECYWPELQKNQGVVL